MRSLHLHLRHVLLLPLAAAPLTGCNDPMRPEVPLVETDRPTTESLTNKGSEDLQALHTISTIEGSDNTVTVRRSNGRVFYPNEDWTRGPYYGTRGTFFADIDGDGRADAIAVNDNTVTVRRSMRLGFGQKEDWTYGPYYGNIGQSVYFAEVTGDRRADAIVVTGFN